VRCDEQPEDEPVALPIGTPLEDEDECDLSEEDDDGFKLPKLTLEIMMIFANMQRTA
jgi:hypothetical protein